MSKVYNYVMIFSILASLVPLAFHDENPLLIALDHITLAVLLIDYFLQIITADFRYRKSGIIYSVRYLFSFSGIIDLLSILPSLIMLNSSFKLLRLARLMRALRLLRVLKLVRYSDGLKIIVTVFKKQRGMLIAVATLALGYILITALIIFNVEPETYGSMFDAIYWATISLTTVGYGDIYPVTRVGQAISMFSSFFGIALIALPSGVFTAGFVTEISKQKEQK
jgi:voltage-gated potassium channel